MAGKRDLYIDGRWAAARSKASFPIHNPATGEVWATVADGGRSDASAAIAAAADAQPGWAALAHSERARLLSKAADVLTARQKEFQETLVDEAGSWIGKAMFETGYSIGVYRAAAAAAYQVNGEILPSDHGKLSLVVREPLGVVSVISPWNFPLLLSSRGFAVALAVGNTIVLKPSEETPVAGGLLIADILEEAGIPKGVFNVITCSRNNVAEVGDELISNPAVRGISFTGSTAVGTHVAAKAGGLLKKCCVELGGKDALIILEDANIERAVNAATFGSFMHQGQLCMSVERVIVHQDVAAEFTEKFVENTKKLKVGNPHEMANCIGPIINQKQLDKIRDQVDDAVAKGAKILCGGKHNGLFFEPTILTKVTRDMKVMREETFGPVAPVITVGSAEEAIEIANDSEFGLSAGIITRNEERGLAIARRLHTGMAHINDSSVNDEPHVPFGGVRWSGSAGTVGVPESTSSPRCGGSRSIAADGTITIPICDEPLTAGYVMIGRGKTLLRMWPPEKWRCGRRCGSAGPIVVIAAACLALAYPSDRAEARKIHGVVFEDTLQVGSRSLELQGLAVKKATVFKIDVYAVALYREQDPLPAVDSLPGSTGMKAVVLEFLRDVDRQKLAGSWMRDLSRNSQDDSLLQQASALAESLPDIKNGQRVTYLMTPERVDILIDREKLGSLDGPEAGEAVLAAFVGERAPRKLREDLLRPLDRSAR